ncbi:MAG: glycosyltransferase family 4 protein [Chloroflexi bacterium]|nr:glycosyltransferase family 4 protein [Chloroflexota bacterium]
MRILFYADGRSPITAGWLRYWIERGDEVHLASSFPCPPLPGLASFRLIPVAFSGARPQGMGGPGRRNPLWGAGALRLRLALRQWLGPLTLWRAAPGLREAAAEIAPDLVHALRIPYEGMAAAGAGLGVPLVVSAWGNDFSLHARSTPLMATWTRRTMRTAAALHSDCRRDVRLAQEWGFERRKPTLVVPGNGGIDTRLFHPPERLVTAPVIVNPRGFRGYVRNDTFFRAIPLVLQEYPQARFLCPSMAGEPQAAAWIEKLGIGNSVELLLSLPHNGMGELFRSAAIMVSPSTHDGTPNTLLEAMACGCFPIVGEVESLHEWIAPGINGLIIDPASPASLAQAILQALGDTGLRHRAALENKKITGARAGYAACMAQAAAFYSGINNR